MPKPVWSDLAANRFRRDLQHLTPLPAGSKLGLAVSGGPDSMALAWLCSVGLSDVEVRVAVVDHGLRATSALEAQTTQARLSEIGLHADILTWKPPQRIVTRKMERARLARYGLLRDWARAQGILRVWLGHHADDQRETVAMRQQQGAQGEGLRGMDRARTDADVRFERPLLDWRKEELLAVCNQSGLKFITDPTNLDPATRRGLLRGEGAGVLSVPTPFAPVPPPVQTRGLVAHALGHVWARTSALEAGELRAACAWVRGGHYAPTAARAHAAFAGLQRSGRASLYGCVIEKRSDGWTLITRETRRTAGALRPVQMEDGRWRVDDRWIVDQPEGSWAFVGAQGESAGLHSLVSRAAGSCLTWNGAAPDFDGTALLWPDNRAFFSPRRPLAVPVNGPVT